MPKKESKFTEDIKVRKFIKNRNLDLETKYNFGAFLYKMSVEDYALSSGTKLGAFLKWLDRQGRKEALSEAVEELTRP